MGITDDMYWSLYRKQGGRCGICELRLRSDRYKRFAVDHDHTTGAIRGLLCGSCNTALGLMKDDAVRLRKAISYLESWMKI